jgi:hypothetical protein
MQHGNGTTLRSDQDSHNEIPSLFDEGRDGGGGPMLFTRRKTPMAHNKLQCRLLLGRVGVEHDPDFPEELTIGL